MTDNQQDTDHPCPGNWQWWASDDGGERMTVGPAETREEIVQMVLDDGLGEYQGDGGSWRIAATILRARENHIDLAAWFNMDRWTEDVVQDLDNNHCGAEEDGCNHPLEEITADQGHDLEASIRSAIRAWQKRHGLKLRSSWFFEVDSKEEIDVLHPRGEEAET